MGQGWLKQKCMMQLVAAMMILLHMKNWGEWALSPFHHHLP